MYLGTYISGKGSAEKLELIDKSFSMLHSSPVCPNLKMLYKSATDMFSEGFIWGNGWWIQNSYGFTMGAVPLLDEFWAHILQNSYDAFWKRIGDGKRIGADSGSPSRLVFSLCAPDGSLGDAVLDEGIVYRQGDGDFMSYDWFYEATAAGVNMQADMLLFDRRPEQLRKYLPLMRRSLNHIESTRAENGLLLVGASSNLLAPSYGGSCDPETGEVGKGYLTGLLITYSSALKKCIELMKMAGDTEGASECQARLDKNLAALPRLLTEEGYLAKSMDLCGTLHGVYGAERYGYLEGVCNVDAIAWDIVSPETAHSIYQKIAAVPGIRSAGLLCNNYPHLDDTLMSYRNKTAGPHSLGWCSGDWVDGGCWATVEGRAILAYQKLGQYEDSFRAAGVCMRWADEYRQDAPFSQWGHNTNNPWQRESDDHSVCEHPVAIMIDNFAPVTCLLRGLFDYTADADGLWIKPQIPDDITELTQHEPIRFGGCRLWMTYRGGNEPATAYLNDRELPVDEFGRIFLPAELLTRGEEFCLTIDRSGTGAACVSDIRRDSVPTGDIAGVPENLAAIYEECRNALDGTNDPDYAAQLREILLSVEAAALRRRLPFDKHDLRPMTDDKMQKIIAAYDKAVQELYDGLKYRV